MRPHVRVASSEATGAAGRGDHSSYSSVRSPECIDLSNSARPQLASKSLACIDRSPASPALLGEWDESAITGGFGVHAGPGERHAVYGYACCIVLLRDVRRPCTNY